MSDCQSLDPLLTRYADGDLDAAGRLRVEDHVRRCAPCRSRVDAERAVHDLMHARRAEIAGAAAPERLRARCAALCAAESKGVSPAGATRAARSVRMMPFAMAAGLVLAAGGVFIYAMTGRSTRVLAAELTADHIKCFGVVNVLVGANADAASIERLMASTFGWQMHVPEAPDAGLELVGARPCLYAKGLAAHLMYRHHGEPLSVFMLPQLARPGRHDEMLDVLGHEAAVWSEGGRTFVLVAREPASELAHVVSAVQASLH